MPYSLASIAMIVFFICVFVTRFFSGGPMVTATAAIAALIAAVALLIRK